MIFPRMIEFSRFVEQFTGTRSAAAVGAGVFADREDDDEQEEVQVQVGEAEALGLANATAQAMDTFLKTLSPTGKKLAMIIAKTHGGGFKAESKLIANAEVTNTSFQFQWSQLVSLPPAL